ncbi:MAG: hypothetical protein K6A72_10775 [Lachnospiraceae bacterium]|nr:hypothetical protein [Lachnospiraceae bacterium]
MLIQQSIFRSLALLSHVSDLDLFNDAVSSYKKEHPDVKSAGSYRRTMITVSGSGKVDDIEITILRIHSSDPCGTSLTSAVIPDILIPHGSYTIRFVLTVLHAYLNRTCPVKTLCARFGISSSTLYDWKRLFEAHYASWEKQLLSARRLHNDLISYISSVPALPKKFLSLFGISFLQSRCRCFDVMHPATLKPPPA